jgi:hypothetical protein
MLIRGLVQPTLSVKAGETRCVINNQGPGQLSLPGAFS